MKRLFDLLAVLLTAPLWLPLLLALSLAVLLAMGWPVFYVSDRAGLGGRPFRFWKLRTMRPPVPGAAAGGASDRERITGLGRLLRVSSLDELPQLFHVLSGKMSLVGPRPLPTAYLPRYDAQSARRHEVRPGLTGLAQVSGRNALDWSSRFRMDVWYVDHRTFPLDLKILWRTLVVVVKRTGVNHPNYDTMCEYKGGN